MNLIHEESEGGIVRYSRWPKFDEKYIKDDFYNYPVMVNGKKISNIEIDDILDERDIQDMVSSMNIVDSEKIKMIVVVKNKVINIVS